MTQKYDITVIGLSKPQVLDLITTIASGTRFSCIKQKQEEVVVPGKTNGKSYGSAEDVMSLGGKSATKGSKREKILITLEKLEKKNGIGTVTRKMLREECARKDQDPQIIYQLIREGYMKVLP